MTRKQQDLIRGWYSYQQLRFRADGSVEARPGLGHPWGVLYTREDAERHIAAQEESSAEIGSRNRRIMFGDVSAADWDEAAWSRIVD